MNEFELIGKITKDLPTSSHLTLGPGDDAAALRFEGQTVVSTDIVVENVHFRRAWSGARDIGRKVVAVNVSDVESMGAKPVAIVVALAVPSELGEDWILEFGEGVREEAERAGVVLAGGDLSRAEHITACVTALGEVDEPVTRAGAQPGDVIAFAGRLGWAGAGMAALSRGFRSPQDVVQEAKCPSVPYGQGRVAKEAGATSMIDISDGLLQDLGHIAKASGVAIDIDSLTLEVAEPMERVGAATGKDPIGFVLGGGEDHALVASFPSRKAVPKDWRVIGEVREGEGVTVDDETPEIEGWDHFA